MACGLAFKQLKDTKSKEVVMKMFFLMFAVMGALLTMSSCNTVEGIGKDAEKAGDAVKDATN